MAGTVENTLSGERGTIQARALVNAAGPWCSRMLRRRAQAETPGPRYGWCSGSHIVVRNYMRIDPCLYVSSNSDGRIVFAIPYEDDFTLIGTDRPRPPRLDPAEVKAPREEIA